MHFPKCGGTAIESIFKKYFSSRDEIYQDPISPDTDKQSTWHDSIEDRENRDSSFRLENRVVVCSIRKLPSWLESRYSFEIERSPELKHDPELLLQGRFLESNGYLNHADYYAEKYLPDRLFSKAKVFFIRLEYFEKDFIEVFGRFVDVSIIPVNELSFKVNSTKSRLPEGFLSKINRRQTSVYDHCPYWKKIETIAYQGSDQALGRS
jgi:hypothetical protein